METKLLPHDAANQKKQKKRTKQENKEKKKKKKNKNKKALTPQMEFPLMLVFSFAVGALLAFVAHVAGKKSVQPVSAVSRAASLATPGWAEALEEFEEEGWQSGARPWRPEEYRPRPRYAPYARKREERNEETEAKAAMAVESEQETNGAKNGGEEGEEEFLEAPQILDLSVAPSPRPDRVEWEADEARDDCNFCLAKFSFSRRRHHCRACGLLVCNGCSRERARVPGYGLLAVRVCDACRIGSIASKKGEKLPLNSIRAFALANSKAKAVEAGKAARDDNDDELLRMSQQLYADLSESLIANAFSSRETSHDEGEDGEDDEHHPHESSSNVLVVNGKGRRLPVRRALFDEQCYDDIPAAYEWKACLQRAEELFARDAGEPVLTKGEVTVWRIAAEPLDAFALSFLVPEEIDIERMCEAMLDLKSRLQWDVDLLPEGCEELRRFGSVASLQRRVTRAIGPVSSRSFAVLIVRCDAEDGTLRWMQTGLDDPELHDKKSTAASQFPQLTVMRRREDGRVEYRQIVHLHTRGWLPISAVLPGMPGMIAEAGGRFLEWARLNLQRVLSTNELN